MQVTSSTQTGASAPAVTPRPSADTVASKETLPSSPPSSTKVTLSDAAKKHYETKDSASEASDDRPSLSRSKSAVSEQTEAKSSNPVKSMVYGALNLQPPSEEAKNPDKAYTAGKWVGAVGTVIGIATLLLRFI